MAVSFGKRVVVLVQQCTKKLERLAELPITRMEGVETYPILNAAKVSGVPLIGFRTVARILETFLTELETKAKEFVGYL